MPVPLTHADAWAAMPRERVVAAVDARPERDRGEAIAWASFEAASAAQAAGRSKREVGAIMLAFGLYATEYAAERAAAIFEADDAERA